MKNSKGRMQTIAQILDITDRKKAERHLRKAKDRYEELFKGAHEIVVTTDPEGYIKRINQRALEKSGYGKDEIIVKIGTFGKTLRF